MEASSLRSVSMSCTWGMFSSVTSSSVRMAAAMQGRAEFLAPETRMVPTRGLPPRITNLSIEQKSSVEWARDYCRCKLPRQRGRESIGGTLPAFKCKCCLLYTSDAADDLLCVDLGGRR